jgi:hypothetical protein
VEQRFRLQACVPSEEKVNLSATRRLV